MIVEVHPEHVVDNPVSIDDPALWELAGLFLAFGQCIVIPTDTVYGLAAVAEDFQAVMQIQTIKERADEFPPPVLVADPDQAWRLVSAVSPQALKLARAFWPGPLTLILPTDRELSLANGTVGLRVPDHDQLRALLRLSGPLATSSANKHTKPSPNTVYEAMSQLGNEVGLYIDGGPTPAKGSSTIVDCCDGFTIKREGLIPRDVIYSTAGVFDG
ncbi:MAG: L-threonylcarbamoyladenylate synthase [Propionibacteriaceae bacterium]|nr:L-threonylcarbamoyladenylate synthase [Propionibacteriaceae bacterium]